MSKEKENKEKSASKPVKILTLDTETRGLLGKSSASDYMTVVDTVRQTLLKT